MGCSCTCHCSCYYTLLSMALLFAAIGFAGCLAGILGDKWWVKGDYNEGLYRKCNITDCYTKDDVFSMDGEQEKTSLVLILLIVSCSAVVIYSVMLLITACAKREKIELWVCSGLFSLFASGVAGGSALAALTYSEIENEEKWEKFDHGWSVICAWIGTGFLIFSFILIIFVVLTGRKDHYIEDDDENKPRTDTFHRDYQRSVDQHCIEMRDQLNRKSLVNHGFVIE